MLRTFTLAIVAALGLAGAAQAQHAPSLNRQDCAGIWKEIGLPKAASGVTGHTTVVCHLGYITGHNDARKGPN
jgi:hypothetical protein